MIDSEYASTTLTCSVGCFLDVSLIVTHMFGLI